MAPRGQRIDGALIGRLRTQKLGITQAEMANRLGIHWVTQSNIENGKALVSLELVERISKETGATRDELLGVTSENGSTEDDSEAALAENGDLSRDEYALFGALLGRILRGAGQFKGEHGFVTPSLVGFFSLLGIVWSAA